MEFYFDVIPEKSKTDIEYKSAASIDFQTEPRIPFPQTPFNWVDEQHKVSINFDSSGKSKITRDGDCLVFKIGKFGEIRSKNSKDDQNRVEALFYEKTDHLRAIFVKALEAWILNDREAELNQLHGIHKLKKKSKKQEIDARPMPQLVFGRDDPLVYRTTHSRQPQLYLQPSKEFSNDKGAYYGHSGLLTVIFSRSLSDAKCGLEEREGERFKDGMGKFIFRFNKFSYIGNGVPSLSKRVDQDTITDAFRSLAKNLSHQTKLFTNVVVENKRPESAETWSF